MESLFDFLFSNIVFVVIVIGALMRLFRGNAEDDGGQQKRQPERTRQQTNPKPTATPSGGPIQRNRQPKADYTTAETNPTHTLEEQQQQQLEKLAGRMNATIDQSMDELSSNTTDHIGQSLQKPKKQPSSKKTENYRKQIKNNLSRDGLVNSVVMAEVLGPARARKPYRSVIQERKS
ncbi:hypothetical protein SAMN05216389_11732 [Oceanobacillus limi]|uniref:Uncharacterized protein n=1 Tax=Oceanobacillus limi TaxID=930131 RepID=A0A1I0FUT5_9BACI|nr:hypothetical protein [Oceanobacillus limi]SET61424.1 hypothetical protein SAMN05216389_11732 [Oceanobacillus limi]